MEKVPYMDLGAQHKPIEEEIVNAFKKNFEKNEYILGSQVELFEENFASYCGVKYAMGVNSGTSALHLALKALGIGPGDEVITTPYTFIATAWAISYVGAKPVFADIDEETFNIDPYKVLEVTTHKTKAIIAVHLYGHPCDLDPLIEICDKYGFYLIEDASQAHGARYKGLTVGAFGHVSTFSFYPAKNLGACGEAGAVVTNSKKLAAQIRLLRNHGSQKRYVHELVGYNYRMESIQGAILNVKLGYLGDWNEQRIRIAVNYNYLLKNVREIILPEEAPWAESVFHIYAIKYNNRSVLCEHFRQLDIGFSLHYPVPVHLQPCYRQLGYKKGDFPRAEKAAQEVINLPIFPGMTDTQIVNVVRAIKSFFST